MPIFCFDSFASAFLSGKFARDSRVMFMPLIYFARDDDTPDADFRLAVSRFRLL